MFSLKPILVDQNIELPKCMYKLKPVNTDSAGDMEDSINNSVSATFSKSYFQFKSTSTIFRNRK